MSAAENRIVDTTTNTGSNSDTMPASVKKSPLHEEHEETTVPVVTFPDHLLNESEGPMLTRHDTEYTEYTQTTMGTTQSSVAAASNFFGSIANLCSATLGAGILALPYAFYQAGFVFGLLLLVISAWATSTSIGLLVQACDKYRLPTYEKIVERVLGRKARNLVEISILIFCCGTAVGYVIAVGDIMERVVYMTRAQKRIAMCVVWLAAMLPLSCLRRMQSLQCASSVGIMSIFTLIVAATIHLVHPPEDDAKPYFENEALDESEFSLSSLVGPAGMSWISVVNACPIFFYAFSCQVNVAQIYEELPGRYGEEKMKKMGWVTWCAVAICGLLYASISVVSLIDFGDGVKPNILSCYDLNIPGQPVLHVAIFAMATAVVMAFPLNIFPSRVALIQMWEKEHHGEPLLCGDADEEVKLPLLSNAEDGHAGYDSGGETNRNSDDASHEDPLRIPPAAEIVPLSPGSNSAAIGSLDDEDEEPEFHLFQHASITLVLAGLALGMALVIPNISVVFGLLGGTTSSLLGFIVPGLLGLKVNKKCVNAWILVIAGSIIGVLTTSVTIYTTFHSAKK